MGAGKKRAIVADDEEAIVLLISSLLEIEGVEILTASDGDEALALIEREGPTIDLACVDIHMPGHGGLDLVKAARAKGLSFPFVIISGEIDDADAALPVEGAQFLAKPFSTGRFREVVRAILGARK